MCQPFLSFTSTSSNLTLAAMMVAMSFNIYSMSWALLVSPVGFMIAVHVFMATLAGLFSYKSGLVVNLVCGLIYLWMIHLGSDLSDPLLAFNTGYHQVELWLRLMIFPFYI